MCSNNRWNFVEYEKIIIRYVSSIHIFTDLYLLFMDAEFLYADISSVNYEFANWLNVSEISDSFRRCALFEFN